MHLNSELFSHFRGSSNIGYLKVKKNDLILSAQNLHLGNCNVNLRFEHGIISPAYKVYELVTCDPLFIQAWVKQDSTKDFFLNASTEGASVCRKNIVWNELYKQTLPIPKLKEQEQIGQYFNELDNLITLHQRKLFLNFAKRNDWEQRKVLDLLIEPVTDGPHETPELVKKGVPFISVDAIVDNKIDFNRKRGDISEEYDAECCKKYKPQLHDVYLVKSGSTVGKVAIVETTERFNIWSPLAAMRCGEKTDPYFLYVLLQTDGMQAQISDKASNGTQPNLSMRELEKFDVQVPQNTDEQKAIGDYFINLDHLITLHRRAYYNKKGGLTNVHNDNQQHYAIL